LSVAQLDGYRLVFHKQGRDGSGKCGVVPTRGQRVIGVVYELSREALLRLDRIEGRGYRRVRVQVVTWPAGSVRDAWTYRARKVATNAELSPACWYLDLVLAGARYHDLPDDYVAQLRATMGCDDAHWLRNRYARSLPDRRLRRSGIRGIVKSIT